MICYGSGFILVVFIYIILQIILFKNWRQIYYYYDSHTEIGSAESDPSTTEPAGELREKAAKNTGEDDSEAPA